MSSFASRIRTHLRDHVCFHNSRKPRETGASSVEEMSSSTVEVRAFSGDLIASAGASASGASSSRRPVKRKTRPSAGGLSESRTAKKYPVEASPYKMADNSSTCFKSQDELDDALDALKLKDPKLGALVDAYSPPLFLLVRMSRMLLPRFRRRERSRGRVQSRRCTLLGGWSAKGAGPRVRGYRKQWARGSEGAGLYSFHSRESKAILIVAIRPRMYSRAKSGSL